MEQCLLSHWQSYKADLVGIITIHRVWGILSVNIFINLVQIICRSAEQHCLKTSCGGLNLIWALVFVDLWSNGIICSQSELTKFKAIQYDLIWCLAYLHSLWNGGIQISQCYKMSSFITLAVLNRIKIKPGRHGSWVD